MDADADEDTDDRPRVVVAHFLGGGPEGGTVGARAHRSLGVWNFSLRNYCHAGTALIPTKPYTECPACAFSYSYVGAASGGGSVGPICEGVLGDIIPAPDAAAGIGYGIGAVMGEDGPAIYMYMPDYPDYGWFLFTHEDPPFYHVDVDLYARRLEGWRIVLNEDGNPVTYVYGE